MDGAELGGAGLSGAARVAVRMHALAETAGVAAPPTATAPVLGPARAGSQLGAVGTAVTQYTRRGPRVYVAEPAAVGLSDAALDYLLGHELAHSVAWRRSGHRASLRIQEGLMYGPAAVVAAVAVAEAVAAPSVAAIPQFVLILVAVWPVLLLAGQIGRMAILRREELAADRWSARLVGTTAGLEDCARWTAANTPPRPPQRRADWLLTATHPRYRVRLAAMRRVLR